MRKALWPALCLISLLPALCLALMPGWVAAADPPVPDPAAIAYLPDPAVLGAGWTAVQTTGLDLTADTFKGGALGVFVGPAGARVLAAVMVVSDTRVVVRRSWEEALDLFRNYSGELEYETDRDDHLASLPPPPGCIEAKRIDGTARQLGLDTGIPMGLTLCAADPDLILLIVVSGAVESLTGFDASDAVASLMLGATESIPVASPTAG